MTKYQFLAEQDDHVERFSLHDTKEEAEKARTGFIMEVCRGAWAGSMEMNADVLAAHGHASKPEDFSAEEQETKVVAFFEQAWGEDEGWETRIKELNQGAFMCPKCGQTDKISILCEPAWATYDRVQNAWEDHEGHEYGSDSMP
jgi:hypothetical protein